MNRTLATAALASLALSAWLVSASACSGGGDGAVDTPSGGGNEPSPSDDAPPEGDPTDRPATETPSPFAPDEPADADGGSPDAVVGDATAEPIDLPPPDPSTAADDGPALQRPIGEGNDTSAIAGLWDYTRETATGTDAVLIDIDAVGNVTEYDNQADTVGSGADCHVVSRASIASRGDDRYDIQDSSTLPGSTSVDDVLITADATEITFRYLGSGTDPQFGGDLTGITERYPAADRQGTDGLTPCPE